MEQIKDLFKPIQKSRDTYRGECMKFLLSKINPGRLKYGLRALTYPRMGKMLQNIPTEDLAYILSVFKDTERRRGTVAAVKEFYWSLKAGDNTQSS